MMPNLLANPVAIFGVLLAGLTVVNTNPLYTARELEHQLTDSEARAIVIVENFASVLADVIGRTRVEHVVLVRMGDGLGFPKSPLINFVVRRVKKMVPRSTFRTRCDSPARSKRGGGRPFAPPRRDGTTWRSSSTPGGRPGSPRERP